MNLSRNVSQLDLFVESRTWRVLQGMMTYSVLLLCVFGNSAALRVFMTPDVFSEARHLLLKSLTFCDLIIGIIQFIVSVVIDATALRGPIFIEAIVYRLSYIPATCSVLHLVIIGLDRCICLFLPLRYPQIVTRRRAIQLVVLAWVYSTLTSSAFMLCSLYKPESVDKIFNIWAIYHFILYILIVGFQFIVIVKVGLLVRKKRREIQSVGGHGIKSSGNISSIKASLRLVLFLTTYTVTFSPFILSDFLTELLGIHNHNAALIYYTICNNLTYLNSFINIFVYAASDSTFRKTTKSIFKTTWL